ncbi:MAG TPA: phosphoenolpyruvate carboxykinase (ATP) [Chitinophagaceae bacterium]|nr:phosphoenolpyruvate carboxykinase (ATP) [Chitinophagaceae bacterium]
MSIPTMLAIPGKMLFNLGLKSAENIFYQLSPEDLINQSVEKGEGVLNNTGALVIDTGEFTGRSPEDKVIVKDKITASTIDWNKFNLPIEEKYFDRLYNKIMSYFTDKKLWIRDCYACAHPDYRLNIRVINENPCCNLFAYNMFLRPDEKDLEEIEIDWHLVQAPHFFADPLTDGVPHKNFVIVNFTKKIILIGGTQYTGEMKKGIFSILNYILPHDKGVLSMHCSANVGKEGDTAIFFGLSGTGKTTLSADPNRELIGDDEHGWNDDSVFNFEGGCYAKTIDLSEEKEPDIYNAIKYGAIVENVTFIEGTNRIDFASKKITENTRVSYPISYISNALEPSIGKTPKNIFFLTADAYGILPPISKLTPGQAMYHFISGYTAKVAGTETGVKEPKPTFSACFGAPFLPLHPTKYAEMLGNKMKEHNVNIWMINTGWNGGGYGVGSRMKLEYTRSMITAALGGKLDNVKYHPHSVFGMMMPEECPGVPSEMLSAKFTWEDKDAYVKTAHKLADYFIKNFEKYKDFASDEILAGAPKY